MKCYLGFLLCTLAVAAAAFVSEDEPQTYSPVGQCPSIDGVYPVLLPDSENRKIFYKCSHGRPWRYECPGGTEFDPILATCASPKLSLGDNIVAKPYEAVGECPEVDGVFPVYLPDSDDLTIFYECSNGEAILRECPDGLLFNPELNVCDYPRAIEKYF